jgi:hypothetical protein
MAWKGRELQRRYEQMYPEWTWERMLAIFFVEDAMKGCVFVLHLLVNRVEVADFARMFVIMVVLAIEGRSRL